MNLRKNSPAKAPLPRILFYRMGLGLLCALALWLSGAKDSRAATADDAMMTIFHATTAIERLQTDEGEQNFFRDNLTKAKAVLIIPSLVKGGFLLGAEWGNGVLLVRQSDGRFSYPAFYTMISGSLGLQIGVQDSEMVLMIMNDNGLRAVMNNAVKVGAGVSIAVATVGAGTAAATTTNLGADIVAFSHAFGLFGGGAFEGAVIKPRESWNTAYYGTPQTAEQILLDGTAQNSHADRLRDILAR